MVKADAFAADGFGTAADVVPSGKGQLTAGPPTAAAPGPPTNGGGGGGAKPGAGLDGTEKLKSGLLVAHEDVSP